MTTDLDVAKQLFCRLKECPRLPNDSARVSDEDKRKIINERIMHLTKINAAFANKHWCIVRHMAEFGYFYDIACRKYLVKIADESLEALTDKMLKSLQRKHKSYDDSKKLFDEMYEHYIDSAEPYDKALSHYAYMVTVANRATQYYVFQYEIHKRRNGRVKMSPAEYQAKMFEAHKKNQFEEAKREYMALMEVRKENRRTEADRIANIVDWFKNIPADATEESFATRAIVK